MRKKKTNSDLPEAKEKLLHGSPDQTQCSEARIRPQGL